jgi:uncharacterized protein (TIGR02246 family)
MMRRFPVVIAFSLAAFVCLPVAAQDDAVTTAQADTAVAAQDDSADAKLEQAEAEIRQAIQAYVDAFNAGQADRLAGLWSEDGVYIDRTSGERTEGRDAMAAQFKELFTDQADAPQLVVNTESIEFVSPRVALERGTAIVTRGDEVTESAYTVVFVRDGDQWLMDRVSEESIVSEPTHYENLRELEWLIGEWVDDDEQFTVSMTCDWTRKQNFISRTFSVSSDEGVQSSGLQIIGWDAKQQQIRSWLFDSDGGFITGTWTKRDDRWIVQSVATLADGSSGSFTSLFRPIDENSYAWQKINRVVDGSLLPNIDEVIIQRK